MKGESEEFSNPRVHRTPVARYHPLRPLRSLSFVNFSYSFFASREKTCVPVSQESARILFYRASRRASHRYSTRGARTKMSLVASAWRESRESSSSSRRFPGDVYVPSRTGRMADFKGVARPACTASELG